MMTGFVFYGNEVTPILATFANKVVCSHVVELQISSKE
ncbi:hypothetical protein SAMN05216428_104130 [Nitrosospira sp. Nsp11]|nr:hypothetical protein SAMN05216428_104130 [Nitrosospira sp. Nsp11]